MKQNLTFAGNYHIRSVMRFRDYLKYINNSVDLQVISELAVDSGVYEKEMSYGCFSSYFAGFLATAKSVSKAQI